MSKKLQTEAIDDKNRPLTKTQRAFVEAYLRLDMNVKGAGREIWGVSHPRSYTQKAWEMFRLPHVKEAIDKRVAEQLHDLGYNKEHLIKEWMKLANADASDFVEWELRYDQETQTYVPIIRMKPSSEVDGACIKSVKIGRTGKIEFELYDKTVAMKQVGEIMGLYPKTQQVEITGKDGQAIQVEEIKNKMLEKLNKIVAVTQDVKDE